MPIQSYRDLRVWQQSFDLVKEVYRLSSLLPKDEQFGLVSQIRRCAVSIPSNIAEGQQRNNAKEYRQFLGIARGSAAELSTQLLLIKELYKLDTAAWMTGQNLSKKCSML
ncbi:MAG TPA: four helix bundle protein [Patescibacteria group bacterium]|nr:four helix bundle protein [Patescibacteria group bacterium]